MKAKIGLALGGGFLRGTAHIGVLKVLEREGIRPVIVGGTSSGSIVASLYAAGMRPAEMEKIAVNLKPGDIYDQSTSLYRLLPMLGKATADFLHLPFPWPAPLGIMRGQALYRLMKRLVGDVPIKSMKGPLVILAADLVCGRKIIFVGGKWEFNYQGDGLTYFDCTAALAVKASTAVPGIFEPVLYREHLLVDGGVLENVPARTLKEFGAERLIAVDVGYYTGPVRQVRDMIELLELSVEMAGTSQVDCELGMYADLVVRPRVENVGLFDFPSIPRLIAAGERAMEEALPHLWMFF